MGIGVIEVEIRSHLEFMASISHHFDQGHSDHRKNTIRDADDVLESGRNNKACSIPQMYNSAERVLIIIVSS